MKQNLPSLLYWMVTDSKISTVGLRTRLDLPKAFGEVSMKEWATDYSPGMQQEHQDRFDALRRIYEAGNIGAPLSAVTYAFTFDVAPPKWVLTALYTHTVDSLIGKQHRKLGRAGNAYARLKQNMVHVARFDAVERAREVQYEARYNLEKKRRHITKHSTPQQRELLKEHEEAAACYGDSWPMAFRLAAASLKGTKSYGSPDTIKASYLLVKQAESDPIRARKFAVPSPLVLEHLDLKRYFEAPHARKLIDLMRSEI